MPVHTELSKEPLQYGPLSEVNVPTTLEDVALQLDILADYPEHDYRHIEADRLLSLALLLACDSPSKRDVHDVLRAFNKVPKHYG